MIYETSSSSETFSQLKTVAENSGDIYRSSGKPINTDDRAMTLFNFHEYYVLLSEEEKSALNKMPSMQKEYLIYNLKNGIESIFNLEVDACFGGTAGICDVFLKQKELYDFYISHYQFIDLGKDIAEKIIENPKADQANSGFLYKYNRLIANAKSIANFHNVLLETSADFIASTIVSADKYLYPNHLSKRKHEAEEDFNKQNKKRKI